MNESTKYSNITIFTSLISFLVANNYTHVTKVCFVNITEEYIALCMSANMLQDTVRGSQYLQTLTNWDKK